MKKFSLIFAAGANLQSVPFINHISARIINPHQQRFPFARVSNNMGMLKQVLPDNVHFF
jgi:hypothetical protein